MSKCRIYAPGDMNNLAATPRMKSERTILVGVRCEMYSDGNNIDLSSEYAKESSGM
jgi:hypothetical protein